MTEAQLTLLPEKAPKIGAEDVALLVEVLCGAGWLTASQVIAGIYEGHGLKWTDRKVRAAANGSKGQVISGQDGYKLTKEASMEEIAHAASWLRHQANQMIERAVEIDRVYYAKGRAA